MKTAAGSRPANAEGEQQAARWVERMFAEIAPRYDLLNHLLSFNIDRGWRKALLGSVRPLFEQADAKILDLCCGTGDVLLDLQSATAGQVMGADFCHPMLVATHRKADRKRQKAVLFEADAQVLPLDDASLDAITIAFGFRNLTNYAGALEELARVLKPGGVLAILEFSHPPGALVRAAYGVYSRAVLPVVGRLVSGSREAYAYLPDSIAKFPSAEELRRMMERAGFRAACFRLLSGGIAALHTGIRAA